MSRMSGMSGMRQTSRLRWMAAGAAVLLLQLAGCASTGRLPAPLALLPNADAGLAAETSTPFADAQWWRALGDPALDALVDQALAGQPSLALAAARLARAGAFTDSIRSSQGPQAGLGLDLTRQRYTENGIYPPLLAGGVRNSGNLQVSGSLELDFFGRHDAALQAAIGRQRAAEAELQAARVLLAANVARAYVGLARLNSLDALAWRSLAQRQAVLDLTRARVQAGIDTLVELRQAEGALPEIRGQIEALAGQRALLRHQLAVLSGQAPQALDTLVPALGKLATLPLPERLGADLLGRRADVVAARWRVEAAAQDMQLARSQFYPDISLVGFVGLNTLGLDRLFSLGSRNYGAGPALRLPLFDRDRLRANLRGSAAEADAAVASYNQAVLEAAREVLDAGAALASLARQQVEQAQAQAAAESAYDLSLQRYRAGLGNYLVVLATETGVLAQRRLGAELLSSQLDSQVSLMRALGGGWQEPSAEARTPPAETRTLLAPATLQPAS
jgi:NodT family efflux transporter outer membrane factor (OMF) lipoprotein